MLSFTITDLLHKIWKIQESDWSLVETLTHLGDGGNILFPPEENWHRLDGGSASLAGGLSGTHSPLYWQNVSTQISIFLPDFSDWENTSHWVEAKRMIQISRWGGELCKVFQNKIFNSMPIAMPDVPWKPKFQKYTLLTELLTSKTEYISLSAVSQIINRPHIQISQIIGHISIWQTLASHNQPVKPNPAEMHLQLLQCALTWGIPMCKLCINL